MIWMLSEVGEAQFRRKSGRHGFSGGYGAPVPYAPDRPVSSIGVIASEQGMLPDIHNPHSPAVPPGARSAVAVPAMERSRAPIGVPVQAP